MAFKPGEKRKEGAGRKKGTPNKRTQVLQEKAEALGVDPFEILLLFAAGRWEALGYTEKQKVVMVTQSGMEVFDDVIDAELRQKSAADACQYLFPKRKAIDMVIDPNSNDTIKVTLSLGDEYGNSIPLAKADTATDQTPPKPKKI